MTRNLTFLHTSPVHIATFEGLLSELAPSENARLTVRHIVDESLLRDAREQGFSRGLVQRVRAALDDASANAGLVVCTCSTIGGCAETLGSQRPGIPVLRIDRPMARQAVALGRRILLATALESTFVPTRALLEDEAAQAGKAIELIEIFCGDAWPHFESGDLPAYHTAITRQLREAAPRGDVIVLAQASMAPAAEFCHDLSIPVLSSPRLGLEAALRLLRALP